MGRESSDGAATSASDFHAIWQELQDVMDIDGAGAPDEDRKDEGIVSRAQELWSVVNRKYRTW